MGRKNVCVFMYVCVCISMHAFHYNVQRKKGLWVDNKCQYERLILWYDTLIMFVSYITKQLSDNNSINHLSLLGIESIK